MFISILNISLSAFVVRICSHPVDPFLDRLHDSFLSDAFLRGKRKSAQRERLRYLLVPRISTGPAIVRSRVLAALGAQPPQMHVMHAEISPGHAEVRPGRAGPG
jgi:hypothetical protein